MRVERCCDWRLFCEILQDYEACFPHLKEKISSMEGYALKVVTQGYVFLAIEEDVVKGICAFYSNDKENGVGYVTLIGVKDDFRKQNIGQRLLEEGENAMRSNGMSSVKLEVDNDNYIAKRFYAKMGYSFWGKASTESCYLYKKI